MPASALGRSFPSLPLIIVLCLLVTCSVAVAYSAEDGQLHEEEFHLVTSSQGVLVLTHGFVDPNTARVFVNGVLWDQGTDFRVQGRSGVVIPLRPWRQFNTGDPKVSSAQKEPVLVMVGYDFIPVPVTGRLDLNPLGKGPVHALGPNGEVNVPVEGSKAYSSGYLDVRGSKTVQVSSGSRHEMTVDQNLRLNITGQLTQDIYVRAFLSDDNLPVIPEGNTEELRDIDKVFVEMKASKWNATLGDFVARRQGTVFGNYRRKLQGIAVEAAPGPARIEVLAGSPRGSYRLLQVRGQEANQGPYYLAGSTGGQNLFIVSGSERVTVDGETLTRGSDRDYIIDYVLGTVTFTYRRLITSESNIVVEYEEGEGPFSRTVVGAGAEADVLVPGLNLPVTVGIRVTQEKDDPKRLRTGELGSEDQAILEDAGDDLTLALAPGAVLTEPGEGNYDEAVESGKTIYIYNSTGGNYNVEFFHAGTGVGDYNLDRISITGVKVFVYVGDNVGSYLCGRPLEMPVSQSMVTMTAAVGDTAGQHLTAEINFADSDRNQLSSLDNEDNKGTASRIDAVLKDRLLRVGDVNLGTVSLVGHFERKDQNFLPFQAHKTIFSYNQWGLEDRARRSGFLSEYDQETGVDAGWKLGSGGHRVALSGHWGQLDHGADLSARQLSGQLTWAWAGGRGRHSQQDASAKDGFDPLDIKHTRGHHEISWSLGPIVPLAHYDFRRWVDDKIVGARASGFRLEEMGVGLRAAAGSAFDWRLEFNRGLADSLQNKTWAPQQDSRTFTGGVTTGRFGGMRLVGEGTLRRVFQADSPEQTTRLARVQLAGNWARTISDWSLGYRVDNSRTEVFDRQVVFVGENQGDYNLDGDYMGPDQGNFNVVMAGTDSLVATTRVQVDFQLRQGFGFLGSDRWYGSWSSMTIGSIQGRSTTDDVGGLLILDPEVLFDRENTVLADVVFSEELTFLKHLKTIDLRGKFDFRQTRDRQFSTHPEDRLARKWQLNSSINVSAKSSLKLRYLQEDDRRYSSESSLSSRSSYKSLTRTHELGWNFRPRTDLRFGLQGEYILRKDEVVGVSQIEYAIGPTSRYRLHKKWTAQANVRVAEVKSEEVPGVIKPWFYPQPGRNVDSSLRLAWDPSEFLGVSLNWFARKNGDRGWQHDFRLESTARF